MMIHPNTHFHLNKPISVHETGHRIPAKLRKNLCKRRLRREVLSDLTNPQVIWVKGWLFATGALMSAGLLCWEHPSLRVVGLLAVCVWCSCRFYYFAFSVVERHVDSDYHFRGIGSFAQYVLRRWAR